MAFIPNPAQMRAIDAELSQSVCIIAGAGTGKTETLARRYVRILRESPAIHPRNIVVLTFTEKAATEMRARIMYAVRDEQLPFSRLDMAEAYISTFHSFAARLALAQSIHLDLDADEPFCDERVAREITDACWEIFLHHGWEDAFTHAKAHIIESVNWDDDKTAATVSQLIDEIQGLAFDGQQLAQALTQTHAIDSVHEALGTALWWSFMRRSATLSQRGQLDLNDIINIVPRLIAHHPTMRDAIKFVMVDEFQDTSTAQAHMLSAITPQHQERPSHLTVVGDPRQAIYVWRQAKVENIVHMRVASDTLVDLAENHRSLAPILAVANASLHNYQFATPPEFDASVTLVPATGASHATTTIAPDCVRVFRYASIHLEAKAIAVRMRELHEQHGINYGSMALLLKQRTHIDVYTAALQAAGIPYDRGKSNPFYHRPLVIDAIHVAVAMVAPHNDLSMTRALFALGVTTPVSLATIRMQHRQQQVWESIQHYVASDSSFATFSALQQQFADAQWYLEPAEWLAQLLVSSGQWQRAGAYGRRMLTKLINDCHALYARDVQALIEVLLMRITHEPDSASPELVTDTKAVQISTVHAAKGLEWDAVFVADAVAYATDRETKWTFNPGFLLYTKNDTFQAHSDELHRQACNETIALWYVALTRAKRWLMVSAYQQKQNRQHLFSDLFAYVTNHTLTGVVSGEITQVDDMPAAQTTTTTAPPNNAQQPLKGQRIITLSPTALHEMMLCPRRYRFLRRSGMSDFVDVEVDTQVGLGTHASYLQSKYVLPSRDTHSTQHDQESPSDTPPPQDSFQSARARTLGTLFHKALELHATLGRDATCDTLCQRAIQQYTRPVDVRLRAELVELVERYLQSPLAAHIPAPHQVERAVVWQHATPDALVEMRCVIDRLTDTQIIDYKTDLELDDIATRHGDQLRINALALQQQHAAVQRWPDLAVYHARSGQLIAIDNSPAAMAGTTARIATAASMIVQGIYPAQPQRHFCQHCPALPLCPEGQA